MTALGSSLGIVAYMALFATVGFVFLFANLLVGRLLRPSNPHVEKLEIYECGEPTIGSSFVQFDLRFYVVALLFIIFDVEVAFFFPWAAVYGGAMQLADNRLEPAVRQELTAKLVNAPSGQVAADQAISADSAFHLGLTGFADILVFFGVLLVGFAYVWKRGDLDWVRAVAQSRTQSAAIPPPAATSAARDFVSSA